MMVTLDDIKNLSLEVSALVKAGLPLESHLADAGRGHSVPLRRLTESINRKLAAGESLSDAVRAESASAPRMLTAAIAAGVRSGRLAETVELMGDMAGDLIELRRKVLKSVSYPLTVLLIAVLLFCIYIRAFLSRVDLLLSDPASPNESPILQQVIALDQQYWWWPLVVPLLGLLAAVVWVASGRASSMAFRGPERILFLLPGVRELIRDVRFYTLSRTLAMLTDRQVPLPDALLLAGACTGCSSLDDSCRLAADQLRAGGLPADGYEKPWRRGELPPLLSAALTLECDSESGFASRLLAVSTYYKRRLNVSVLWLKHVVPVALFLIIGGGTLFVYSMSVFWPVTEMYYRIGGQ